MKHAITRIASLSKRAKRASFPRGNLLTILGPVVLGIALVMAAILALLALPADELSAQGPMKDT